MTSTFICCINRSRPCFYIGSKLLGLLSAHDTSRNRNRCVWNSGFSSTFYTDMVSQLSIHLVCMPVIHIQTHMLFHLLIFVCHIIHSSSLNNIYTHIGFHVIRCHKTKISGIFRYPEIFKYWDIFKYRGNI